MVREALISALWWFGLLWVVVGMVAFLYSLTGDGPLDSFVSRMQVAVWILLAPGIVAMMTSLFLSSRVK